MPHATAQVFYDLRAHLRAHRLRAVVIGNHDRVAGPLAAQQGVAGAAVAQAAASAGPQVARPGPVTLWRGGQLPASRLPANMAGWSTPDRLMALLHDTLPLLGPALRAHLEAMTGTEAVAHLLAGMALMAGLQAVPVLGEAADAAFPAMAYAYAGWDGLLAVVHLTEAMHAAVEARSEAEIAAAAPGAAAALVTLGGAFLDAVALRMAKRNTSGGGRAAGDEGKRRSRPWIPIAARVSNGQVPPVRMLPLPGPAPGANTWARRRAGIRARVARWSSACRTRDRSLGTARFCPATRTTSRWSGPTGSSTTSIETWTWRTPRMP